ncbi:MAG: DUF3343 domain-containing protein [Oscillospiraceae bacterium]|jgi:hypothetical protein
MIYYLINCRSLTYAQRAKRILERAGISAYITRTPQGLAKDGCSHSVKVSERRFEMAMEILKQVDFPITRVYMSDGEGRYSEVLE